MTQKQKSLPSRFQKLPPDVKAAFKENFSPSNSVWEGLKYVLEDMLEDKIRESEKVSVYEHPGHYESRIHMEGQRQTIRHILSFFPTAE